MEPKCDYCATAQAVIYCKSDLAKLCLNCDIHIHSANPLSRRHTRYLICDKCFSQPAIIQCLNDKVSHCQGCHWHASNCSALGHKLQTLSSFSGCPSPNEYVRMWSSILEPSVSDFIASSPLNEASNAMFGIVKTNKCGSSYSMVQHNTSYTHNLPDQSSFISVESKGCSDLVPKLGDGEEDLCEGLNMDNAPLNFDVGNDIIGCSIPQDHIELNHALSNCLIIDKNNTSVTASNITIDNACETTSPGQQDSTSYHSSPLQMNINTSLPLPTSPVFFGQIYPTMALTISNITGENIAPDYKDCVMSPGFMPLLSDSPWESNLEVSCPQARTEALLRYKEKRLKRTFGKQIRYASRKARADTRKRVKGRFVKAGDNYDYDPSSPTTDH